nr:hypothetical protein [Candidatus Freyarchaeota archaeon]
MAKSKKMAVSLSAALIGGLFAVISTVVGAVSILGAVVTYTVFPFRPMGIMGLPFIIPVINTGYNFWYQYVSEMSAGPSAFLYNVGVIVSGILAIPVFPCMLRLLRSTVIAKIGVVAGVVASIGMSMSSVYPLYVHSAEHGIFAMVFFVSIGISIVLLSYEMFRGKFFSKVNVALGVIFVGVDLSFLLIGNSVTEWSVFFMVVVWLAAAGIHMLIRRNVTEV